MKDSYKILETIDSIDKCINKIKLEKTSIESIKTTFPNMGEFSEILIKTYSTFSKSIDEVVNSMTRADKVVSEVAMQEYFKVSKKLEENLNDIMNNMLSVSIDE